MENWLSWETYVVVFFFQAEDGIRDLVRSRGLGDVYKRQARCRAPGRKGRGPARPGYPPPASGRWPEAANARRCLLYTSDAADERSSVDLGGRRIIKKKTSAPTEAVSITHKEKTKRRS